MADGSGWHHEDIKAELRKQYGALSVLSRRWGYHRGAITRVLRRPLYSIPLERLVADALRVAPDVLWPDRWHPDGIPKPLTNEADPSPRSAATHRQKEHA